MTKKAQEQEKIKKNTTKKEKNMEESNKEVVKDEIKKEKKGSQEKNIKKPANEKLAKEKKKAELKNKAYTTIEKVDQNRYTIIAFIIGVAITALIARIIWPDRIATLKDGTEPVATIDGTVITANELYEEMKNYYNVSQLLENVDKIILEKLYPEDDEMKEEVNSNAEYYLNIYKSSYGYTQEQFLEYNGFNNYDEFLDYLRLDYRRSKYTEDYIKENLTDKEIEKYYNDNVFGAINCQHILVQTSDSVDDETAKNKVQEIIDKLNNGTSWEDVQTEYKDDITFEDLGYQEWNANLESTFMDALKTLDDNSYSKEPVQTSYGYHVIYRLDQKEKPTLEDEKDKIIDELIETKKSEDDNIQNKALISLRKDKELTFSDTVMEEKYKKYCKNYE